METSAVGQELERALHQLEDERQRRDDLAAALAAAQLQIASLEQRLRDAVPAPDGAGDSDQVNELRAALAEQTELAEQYRVEAADAKSMFDAMQHRIDVLTARAAREPELREQLAEVEAQRRALAEEVEEERRARAALEAAASVVAAESRESNAASRITSLQQAFDDAVLRHAQEARALREDAELHKALARDRESELTRVTEECSILRQSVENTIVEMEGLRAERSELSQQLRRLEESAGDSLVSIAASDLRLEEDAGGGPQALSSNDLEAMLGDEENRPVAGRRAIVVVNFDDDPVTQDSVARAVESCPGAIYAAAGAGPLPAGDDVQLVVNLASEQFDLDLLSECERWGVDEPEAFTYCAKDGRGISFRKVMFFPPPCDFDECSARLLTGADTLQRVLAVGEDVDFMSGLRESLGRVRTSTAIAFDGRQAVDLIPMVKPQMVLVDLNLPRGGGLRVASQIAANPDLRNVAIALFWSRPIDPVAFRQQAVFALRDAQLDSEQLTRSITQMLHELSRNADAPALAFALSNGAAATASSQAGR